MTVVKRLSALVCVLTIFGCSTTTQFRLPSNTDIVIKEQRFSAEKDGYADVTVTPFFWTGIGYQLMRGDKVIEEGKMDSHFRFVSLFWPPYAVIYWPKGFSYDCYDMTKKSSEGEPEPCAPAKHEEKKKKQMGEAKPPWRGL